MTAARGPAETAPDQVARLLALVPYLIARGDVRLEDAAAHFGVTTKQLDKDLRLLFMTGLSPGLPGDLIDVDIEALEGEGVIRVDNADYLARPVRFSPGEATALIVALRTLLETVDGEARKAVESTLEKLTSVADATSPSVLPLHVDEEQPSGSGVAETLRGAIERGRQVRIDYHVASRDERSVRVVDPRGIARVENVLYLDAYCHRAEGERVFRLDRIVRADELETGVSDRVARPRDLTQGWFADGLPGTVRVRLQPPAFWVTEYFPIAGRSAGPGGTVEVDLPVSTEAWLTRLLLRLSPHATVIEPPDMQATFTRALLSTRDRYASER